MGRPSSVFNNSFVFAYTNKVDSVLKTSIPTKPTGAGGSRLSEANKTFIMQITSFVFVAMLACAYARVAGYPDHPYSKVVRHPRDLDWSKNVGRGTVFGKLGTDDLSGTAGYRHNIYEDSRGKLDATAYGSRSLPYDSTSYGGKLNWHNPNDDARIGLDVNRQIGGRSGASLTAEKAWRLDRDSDFVLGAGVHKTFGHGGAEGQIYGGIERRW